MQIGDTFVLVPTVPRGNAYHQRSALSSWKREGKKPLSIQENRRYSGARTYMGRQGLLDVTTEW